MLSKSAFNALLKTLEEPPAHVKFILATTEPEKVLPTILSRCQRYDFRNIPTREIAGHLKSICKTEKIEADDDALLLVAKAGAGSMRDSLSLLDRLLSVGETRLTVDLLEQMLGLAKSQLIFDLVAAVGTGDVKSALSQADAIIANGLAVDTLIASLIDHLRNLLVLRTCGTDSQLVEVPGLSLVDLGKQADQFDPAALSQDIVILEELRRHVRQSQAGRALLDATLVRMALADQFSSLSDLLANVTGGAAAQKKKPVEMNAGSGERSTFNAQRSTFKETPAAVSSLRSSTVDVGRSTFASPPPEVKDERPTSNVQLSMSNESEDRDDDLPAPGKVWDGPRESLAELMKKHVTSAAPAVVEIPNIEPVTAGDLGEKWKAMIALLADHGPSLHGLLQQGQFIGITDGRAVIRYAAQHETFVKLLERNGKKDLVRNALSKVLDQPVGVKFEIAEGQSPVPHPIAPPRAVEPPRSAAPASPPPPAPVESSNTIRLTDEIRDSLYKNNPLIRAVADTLGGSIIRLEEPE
jgi:hypothetical protein